MTINIQPSQKGCWSYDLMHFGSDEKIHNVQTWHIAEGEKIYNDIERSVLACHDHIIMKNLFADNSVFKNEPQKAASPELEADRGTSLHRSSVRPHHPLSRILKGILGTVKVFLGVGMAILTSGTGVGVIGGSLMALSGVNELICSITGRTLGEHILNRWPDNLQAKRAATCVDTLLKISGIFGGVMGCGLASGINIMFDVNLPQLATSICGGVLGLTDEISKLIDGCMQKRAKKNIQKEQTQELIQEKAHVNEMIDVDVKINAEDVNIALKPEVETEDSYLNYQYAILA